jgi:hypothetical protein
MTKKPHPDPGSGRIEFARQWGKIRESLDEGWSMARIYRHYIDPGMISYNRFVRLIARQLAAEELTRDEPGGEYHR